jgi:hypothetical protein
MQSPRQSKSRPLVEFLRYIYYFFSRYLFGKTIAVGMSESKNQQKTPETFSAATKALSAWIEEVTLDAVPEEVKTRTKYLILDGIGCAMVGARLPWSAKARDAITRMETPGKCTVFGWNQVCSSLAF